MRNWGQGDIKYFHKTVFFKLHKPRALTIDVSEMKLNVELSMRLRHWDAFVAVSLALDDDLWGVVNKIDKMILDFEE